MNNFFFSKIYQRRSVLLLLICITAFYLCYQIVSYSRFIVRNLKQIVQTSEEQRKGRTYESIGYDYINYVSSIIPEPEIFPKTRYINYTHNVEELLPINVKKIDKRVVIGINIPQEDMKEWGMVTARKLEKQSEKGKEYWAFNTINDYDSLTAIHFIMDRTQIVFPLKITMYSDASEKTVLGSWEYQPEHTENNTIIFQLPEKLENFSFTRGSRDFILTVEQIDNEKDSMLYHIQKIELYGIKVDLEDYQIVHRAGKNFTAMTNEFLHIIERDSMTEWKHFLLEVKK